MTLTFLTAILTCSIVGSVIFGTFLLLRAATGKIFSKSWQYYSLLVPIVFLLGGATVAAWLLPSPSYEPGTAVSSPPLQVEVMPPLPSWPTMPTMPPQYITSVPVNTEIQLPLPVPVIEPTKAPATPRLEINIQPIAPFILAMWAVGAVLFVAISTIKYQKYRHYVLKNATPIADEHKLPIIISEFAHTPMLLGILKPMIVLPNMPFTERELSYVIAHETEHYRRKDLLVKLITLVANAVHWFNPAAYALARQLSTQCELACDEKVVTKLNAHERIGYGETILQVLGNGRKTIGNVAFATNLCSSKKNFKRRLLGIMKTHKMTRRFVAMALALVVAVTLGGLAVSSAVSRTMPVRAEVSATAEVSANEPTNTDRPTPVEVFNEAELRHAVENYEYIEVVGTINIENYIAIISPTTIGGNGTIAVSDNSRHFHVHATLTLEGGIEITRAVGYSDIGGGISVYGTLIMNGGRITQNLAPYGGGGVYVNSGAVFTMHDGEIVSNHASTAGGGVFMESSSEFTIYGGTITGNTAGVNDNEISYNFTEASFMWPHERNTLVASMFGNRLNPINMEREFHTGIDIPAPTGASILAAKDGYVTFAGWRDLEGNTVVIAHDNGYTTIYAHASYIHVQEGQFVQQGEVIALVGETGEATGPHLHFEIRQDNFAIDPLSFFAFASEANRLTDTAQYMVHTIEVNIPRLYPEQRVVFDPSIDIRSNDTIWFDLRFEEEEYGLLVAFVRNGHEPCDGQFFYLYLRNQPESASDHWVWGMQGQVDEDGLYLDIRNWHPEDSGRVIENITGTVTIFRERP